jgi:hypothetical protein
MELTS